MIASCYQMILDMSIRKFTMVLYYLFLLLSLLLVIWIIFFIVSQEINLKYYFKDCLPNSIDINMLPPIFHESFWEELILDAKILFFYAMFGVFISIYSIKRFNNKN